MVSEKVRELHENLKSTRRSLVMSKKRTKVQEKSLLHIRRQLDKLTKQYPELKESAKTSS